ncbi:hypothetical protein K2173_000995 [Erythroxylum novogranatense]|uniref:Callose synthase helical domain-containing protein n=1 Tax=Erythroxylum novogranatense TaxID=1862640 RepID=A0AAV8TSJ3_9ROSI|nr:hypothetical protein K2173_000995 [Erythroxylum novogranatense]
MGCWGKFVELVEILKESNPSKRDTVVLLLQDMLVVTRDMMVNENRELIDLGHSGKDSERQLFVGTATRPAIMFPPPATVKLYVVGLIQRVTFTI